MKKRFTEEQIIGFLREAEAGMPVKELCRKHGFSEASCRVARGSRALRAIGPLTACARVLSPKRAAKACRSVR